MAYFDRTVTFDDVDALPDRWTAGLPRLVPMVDAFAVVAEVDPLGQWAAYALGLRRVFSAHTGRILPSRGAAATTISLHIAMLRRARNRTEAALPRYARSEVTEEVA